MKRRISTAAISGLFVLVGVAGAQTVPTAEQVLCESTQLARLARRISVGPGNNGFFWRGGSGAGMYRGLVARDPFKGSTSAHPSRFELQVAFDLLLTASEDRLGPTRPLLPQARLSRRDASTNLVPTHLLTGDNAVGVGVELGLSDFHGRILGQQVSLTNILDTPPEFVHQSGAGWGIVQDGLASACHPFVSERDLRVYQILSRTLRVDSCGVFGIGCVDESQPLQIGLYRATGPDTYFVDIYSYNQETDNSGLGATTLLLRFERDAQGRLTMGTARFAVEGCTPQACQTFGPDANIFFLPPLTPGRDRQGPEVIFNAPRLNFSFFGSGNIPETTIDWAALLAGTVYNENWP